MSYPETKPTVELDNWYMCNDHLHGDATGHPKLGDANIRTSTVQIVDFEDGIAVTKNTIYKLKTRKRVEVTP